MKHYRSIKSIQRDLRKCKEIPDYIKYKGQEYEMNLYDLDGKIIVWSTNKLPYQAIEMLTLNRYGKTGTKDATVNYLN